MKKTELVFLPITVPGHLVPTVEFSKRLIANDARLSITIIVINSPFSRGTRTDPTPGIRYVTLPELDMSPDVMKESMEHAFSSYVASYRAHVRAAITALQTESHVAGLFLDMFCTSMIDVANELGLPSYIFFCSSAGFLGFLLHLPVYLHRGFDESRGPDELIPCFKNPVPTRVLPGFRFNNLGYKAFLDHANRFRETNGIVINTFAELEPFALKSLSEHPRLRDVPIYTVGPVLDLDSEFHKACDAAERERMMKWLDKQPDSSVIFLCFGSGGSFSQDQTTEISKGLSESGQRFLWSIRKPPTPGLVKPTEYTKSELTNILSDEFRSLLDERGLVCGWVPQVEILAHKAVGAFVSHCGWNSTLESLWFGKPIVTWPLYAEQQLNAFDVVKELGIAVELTLDYRLHLGSLVLASEVERAVRSVMDDDNAARCKVKEMMEICKVSLMGGGSSFDSVDRLIAQLLGDQTTIC